MHSSPEVPGQLSRYPAQSQRAENKSIAASNGEFFSKIKILEGILVQRESKIQTDFRPLGVHPGGIHEAVADDLVVGPFRPSVRSRNAPSKPSLRTLARKASVSGPKSNHSP